MICRMDVDGPCVPASAGPVLDGYLSKPVAANGAMRASRSAAHSQPDIGAKAWALAFLLLLGVILVLAAWKFVLPREVAVPSWSAPPSAPPAPRCLPLSEGNANTDLELGIAQKRSAPPSALPPPPPPPRSLPVSEENADTNLELGIAQKRSAPPSAPPPPPPRHLPVSEENADTNLELGIAQKRSAPPSAPPPPPPRSLPLPKGNADTDFQLGIAQKRSAPLSAPPPPPPEAAQRQPGAHQCPPCPICLETDAAPVVFLHGPHSCHVHLDCFRQWVASSGSWPLPCPICLAASCQNPPAVAEQAVQYALPGWLEAFNANAAAERGAAAEFAVSADGAEEDQLQDVKRCPRCRRPGIKDPASCNRAKCPWPCGHKFCWTCGASLCTDEENRTRHSSECN